MGRRTKLTPETQARIIEAIDLGAPYYMAAAAAGVSERAFMKWLAEGREENGRALYREFVQAIKTAEAKRVCDVLLEIQKSAKKHGPSYLAWWLERRYPNDWGRPERMTTGNEQIDEDEKFL